MSINELLKIIQKTNPDMTKDKLIAELSKENYIRTSLCLIFQNQKKKER